MTWGLTAVAAATLVGGGLAYSASNKAANAQVQGANDAVQIQREGLAQQQQQFDQSRSDVAPWRDVGANALLTLSDQLGIARPAGQQNVNTGNPQFKQDPGYQFAFDQGLKAVDSRFPGMSRSGAKAQALTAYGQGQANQQYGNWLSRLGTLAGYGQTAGNTLAQIGTENSAAIGNSTNTTGNLIQNAAASRASGYVGGANAVNSSIGSGINNLASLYGVGAFGSNPLRQTVSGYPVGQTTGSAYGWT